jgi:1-acyl-sn-glycerol-3-phosphate acyltransferase
MMKAMYIYRFWLKTTLFFLVTLILAPWYFLLLLIFYRWRYCIGPKLVQFYFKICLLVFRVHIEHVKYDGIKNKNGKGFLILANHASFLDIFVLSAQFGTVFLSKSEIKYYPLIGQIAWLMGVIFLNRDASHERVRVLSAIAGRCTKQVIAVFPQGTTSGISDRLPFNRGIFKVIELNPGLSLLPVTIYYKEDAAIAWKKPQSFRENLIRVCSQDRIHLKILIHDPVTIENYRDKTASQICKMVEHTILEPLRAKYES